MNIAKKLIIGSIVLVLLIFMGVWWFLNSSKPVYSGELILDGLNQQVEVYYDSYGIPHIYAENEEDLYFALGYVHAQDRLFQMELLRRVGGGNLSEILGPELIQTDRFMRTIGINETAKLSAKANFSSIEAPFQKAALAYLQGLNTYLTNGPTPPEFTLLGIPKKEFAPVDLYRIVGYMGFSFNAGIRTDPLITDIASQLGSEYLNTLQLNTTRDNTTIPTDVVDSANYYQITKVAMDVLESLPVPPWMGSNSWAVGPDKTVSGFPMLANDTHIAFSQPAVFYEAHLNCPGYNFYGNHLAGFPFALIGHNDFSTWGITIFPNDDMDFYREKPNPEDDGEVWFQDHWEKLDRRTEKITVKGQDDVEFVVKSSRHGPIINEVIETVDQKNIQPVSFFWTFNKFPSKALQVAYSIDHSKSIDEFRSAISLLEAPGLNFTYADKDGNIAWWAAARLMDRPAHVESKIILDGSSGEDEIIGWFPFSKNPKSENPSSGFVYSANNQPDSTDGIMHPGYYYPGARGQRIMQLLSENDRWDQSGFQEMILDDLSPTFPEIAGMICGLVDGNLTAVEKEALNQLVQWNGSHNLSDVGPTIYYSLVYHLQKNMIEDELGSEPFKVYLTTLVARRSLPYLVDNDSNAWWDNIHTSQVETRNEIVNQSFKDAVKDLADSFGEEPSMWTWDQAHLIEHVHAIGRKKPFDLLFNVGPFPVTGGDEVINKMDFDKTQTIHRVKSGPAMRIIIDLADMHNSISVLPTGQSGHLMSPHYKDQTELYLNGKFRPQHMDKQKIVSEQSRLLLLKPGQL